MESEQAKIAACAALYVILSGQIFKKLKKRKRRWWLTSLYKSRDRYNVLHMLSDMSTEPAGYFENFCRMSAVDFQHLLNKIGPLIQKQDTNMRKSITVQEKLAITLRFLATGDSYISLSYLFKVSKQSISRCVDEVCKALISELKDEIKIPQSTEEWLKIATDYKTKWNFPHCIGALDGKHIVMQSPINSGSEYYNYKGTFSIVLMAIVDANYNFIFVDIGCQGRISDGGVFRNTTFFKKLENNEFMFPVEAPLSSKNIFLPYVIVTDDAFPLNPHIMKPFSGIHEKGSLQRIFNYRCSRARPVVENVFGIMSSVFRVFRKPMLLQPEKVKFITMTCTLLHNFLRRSRTSSSRYIASDMLDSETDGHFTPGQWQQNNNNNITSFIPLQRTARRSGLDAKLIREQFAEYFMTDGKVQWQDNI